METFLNDCFKDTDVLWRQKSDFEYVCVADSSDVLESCMQACLDKETTQTEFKIQKMILVKDILKQPQFGNPKDAYFSILLDALKRYKVDQILDSDDPNQRSQIQDFIQTKPIKKSKLYITMKV